jgi:threonine dehydrogenase-like Zn-dependent dehydrogenase
MSDKISAGDLVVIIKPLACGHGQTGYIFTVKELVLSAPGGGFCSQCKAIFPNQFLAARHPDGDMTDILRLKRIPPLSEMEHTKETESVPA